MNHTLESILEGLGLAFFVCVQAQRGPTCEFLALWLKKNNEKKKPVTLLAFAKVCVLLCFID